MGEGLTEYLCISSLSSPPLSFFYTYPRVCVCVMSLSISLSVISAAPPVETLSRLHHISTAPDGKEMKHRYMCCDMFSMFVRPRVCVGWSLQRLHV